MATYGQYPAILADQLVTEGPAEVTKRIARNVTRALRHGA
jgi:hypothetical protein